MDTHSRLQHLMAERGWTAYRLARESGLSESTLANIFKRNIKVIKDSLKQARTA